MIIARPYHSFVVMYFRFLLAKTFGLKAGDMMGIFVAGLCPPQKSP
jgi:hypothetical protein